MTMRISSAFLLVVCAAAIVRASTPGAPTNCAATWYSWNSPAARVTWTAPANDTGVLIYRIYGGHGTAMSAQDTSVGWYIITSDISTPPQKIYLNSIGPWSFYVVSYRVTASGRDTVVSGPSEPSNVAVLTYALDSLTLQFTSQPPTECPVDSWFSYQPSVNTPQQGAPVWYTLLSGPSTMSVQQRTGALPIVTWVPRDTGTYAVTLGANDNAGNTGIQQFSVHVGAASHDSSWVIGEVSGDGNQPVAGAAVTFYGDPQTAVATATTSNNGYFATRLPLGCFDVTVKADTYSDWHYSSVDPANGCLHVFAGRYDTLMVNMTSASTGSIYVAVVVDDSAAGRATVVTERVGDDRDSMGPGSDGYGRRAKFSPDPSTPDMIVASLAPGWYHIGVDAPGYLTTWCDSTTDESSARAIRVHARDVIRLVISPVKYVPPTMRTISGTLYGKSQGQLVPLQMGQIALDIYGPTGYVEADANGKWHMSIEDGRRIALRASAGGFIPSYWNGHASPLDADSTEITADNTAFDMTLDPLSWAATELTGHVTPCAGTRHWGNATVILYQIANNTATPYFSTVADSNGAYRFYGAAEGTYYVSALQPRAYAESYYTTSGMCTTDWHNASSVTLRDSVPVTGIDIPMTALDSTKGGGVIGGHVIDLSGSMPGAGKPGRGVVIAWTQEKTPAGSGATDANGSFQIPGLMPGTYPLTFSRPGYKAVSLPDGMAVLPGDTTHGVVIDVMREDVSGVDAPLTVPHAMTMSVHPNPCADATTVTLTMPGDAAGTVELFALTGARIATLATGRLAGTMRIALDASDLRAGCYLVRARSAAGTVRQLVTVIK